MSSLAKFLYPFRRMTSGLRALPNVVIIGAQKAGTTYLFDLMKSHPEVTVSFRKEVHFFDRRYTRGLGWYRSWFPCTWMTKRVVLEASPFYMMHPHCAERIHAELPTARLIVILRNPVSRAYSGYQHQCRGSKETLSFADALAKEDERTAADHLQVGDPEHPLKALRTFSYRERGLYFEQLSRYMKIFPRENILVVCSERMFSRPDESYARICRYLGIAECKPPQIPPSNSGGKYVPIDPSVAAELKAFYVPHNQRLYELVGEDFGW